MKAAVVAVSVLVATVAHAQPVSNKERATERAEQAKQLFAAKDFVAAAHAFEEAYALDRDPAHLFNIAQAYRSGGACADSARYFRTFLAEAPEAPNRESVEGLVKEVDACAAEQAAVHRRREPLPPPPPKVAPTRGSRRTLGIAIGAAGAVSLAVGAWFTWDVFHLATLNSELCGEFGKPGQPDCVWSDDKERREKAYDERGRRAQIIAVSALTVGGLAVAGGIVLYLSGGRTEPPPVAVAPVPGGAVATFGLRF